MNEAKHKQKRPYLGIMFECCHVYARVYRQPYEMFYQGQCPRCLRRIKLQVNPVTGSQARIWRAH